MTKRDEDSTPENVAPGAATEAEGTASSPVRPFTLAVDIGGTGLKASVLDAGGAMVADRVKVATTYPMSPDQLVATLATLVAPLPTAERASVGFPGMVRAGVVLSAPHFSTEHGPGSPVDPDLARAWDHFDLTSALTTAFSVPTKVANDADIQGAAVISGHGLEMVVTLGTGFGSALFYEGRLLPHLEIAHQPFHKHDTYDDRLGEAARKEKGDEHWMKQVHRAIANMRALCFFDHLYIGGGNARRLVRDELDDDVTIVDNSAGILGGIKLWEGSHLAIDQPDGAAKS
jgi:polyphosphate glucokinase